MVGCRDSNLVKSLPWMSSVRAKITDPSYHSFWLKFAQNGGCNASHHGGCNGTHYVPQCDVAYKPPRCSELCARATATTSILPVAAATRRRDL
eukprot:SAG25_NODE_6695_length_537_cov_1.045662_2_plen_92_part_01